MLRVVRQRFGLYFPKDDVVVIAITGNGLKTQEAIAGELGRPTYIQANLASLDTALKA